MACPRDPRLLCLAIDSRTCHNRVHTMLLKMLLCGSHKLDSSELVAVTCLEIDLSIKFVHIPTSLEPRDDRADESTLNIQSVYSRQSNAVDIVAYLDAIRLDSNEAVNQKISFTARYSCCRQTQNRRIATYVCSLDIMSSLSLALSSLWAADARRKP